MESQSKLDLIAGSAILLMFVGAFIFPLTSLGLILIAAGVIVMLLLFLKIVRKEQ